MRMRSSRCRPVRTRGRNIVKMAGGGAQINAPRSIWRRNEWRKNVSVWHRRKIYKCIDHYFFEVESRLYASLYWHLLVIDISTVVGGPGPSRRYNTFHPHVFAVVASLKGCLHWRVFAVQGPLVTQHFGGLIGLVQRSARQLPGLVGCIHLPAPF